MKILVIEMATNKQKVFSSVEKASKHYNISVKRILERIKTGGMWKQLLFDEA